MHLDINYTVQKYSETPLIRSARNTDFYINCPKFVPERFLRNVERKGEVAHYEQVLLFAQCLSFYGIEPHLKLLSATPSNSRQSKICHLTIVNPLPHNAAFDAPTIYSCGKHCEKRRNCL